ncbi:YciC family protein [Candidatus Curculioniphilus buchneri]|uniref:YciC family protein n=1 Tax=Candidatus Curculioniphilus buchneri TaxID=690594 RepID=UPI00376ECC84
MPIMVSTLCRDMLNFFRNQCVSILLLSMIVVIISTFLGHILSPSREQLFELRDNSNVQHTSKINLHQFIKNLSKEQQNILLKASAASTISNLVGNVLLIGSLLTMIHLISTLQPVNILRILTLSISSFPRMLLLVFLTTLLIQIGFLFLILPGIFFSISFSLAPVIVTSNNNVGVIRSMTISGILAFKNIWLLAPAVSFWILAKTVIFLLENQYFFVSTALASILLNYLSNLISSLLLIYLYRLYMLLR